MNRCTSPIKLTACVFALLCLVSIGQASPPFATHDGHFHLPLEWEDMRARDSLYAASKHALNLNVGEPRTVRMIYFLPNDRPHRAEIVQKMKDEIRHIQTFYRDQMRAHGHGDMTFRFETDAQGEPLVHRVDGQHPDSHYLDDPLFSAGGEIGTEQVFDLSLGIYFIVIDNSTDLIGRAKGRALISGKKNHGVVFVPGGFHWTTAAHELGHTFGLEHDWRDGAHIMSYGTQRNSLSACATKFLLVHPYFNPEIPIEDAQPPTIKPITSHLYPTGSKNISIQLRISDPDGLNQVLLYNKPLDETGLRTCQGLNKEKTAVVQFDYDGAEGIGLSDELFHQILVMAVDTRGNRVLKGFRLWDVALGILADFQGHVSEVHSVAFSPDGATLASGADASIKLWDIATRTEIATLEGHIDRATSVAFSPDGATLASTISNHFTVGLWNVATRTNIAILKHTEGVHSVVFSPDGATLASQDGPLIKLWDIATRTNIATLEGHISTITSVVFSPDGTTLASASYDVKLWDVATRTNIATLEGHRTWISSVAFSPDGTILASGAPDRTVKLWDIATRTNIATLKHTRGVHSVAFSPDGSTLASGLAGLSGLVGGGTVELWDIATRTNIAILEHGGWINSVAFSPDGTMLASGSDNGTVLLWDIPKLIQPRPRVLVKISGAEQEGAPGETLANPYVIEVKDQYGNPLQGARVRFTVTAGDGRLTVENATTDANGRAQSTLTLGKQPGINVVEVSVDELEAAFNVMGGRTWQLPAGAFARLGSVGHPEGIAFSPDGTTLFAGNRLWDVATGRYIPTLEGVNFGVFSPDGATLVLITSWGLNLWNVSTRESIATLKGPTAFSVTYSPDGLTLASGSIDDTVKLWDVATRTEIATLEGHTDRVTSVAYSPDGSTLASGSWDKTVKLWDIATRTEIATLEGHTNQVFSIAFSPDETTLASGSDSGVRLWDVAMRKEVAFLRSRHRNEAYSVAFSPDGTTLASGAWERVKLWDVATRTEIATLEGHVSRITSVAFSPDGTTLASGSSDGTVLLWDMSPYVTPVVIIPDANLHAVIRDVLGKSRFAPITVTDMASLTTLDAHNRNIQDLTGLEFATNLTELNLVDNPLNAASLTEHIPTLQDRGVAISFDKPTTLVKISGDKQEGVPGEVLTTPLVVEVQDQNGEAIVGVSVTFAITAGGGSLSVESVLTNSSGRASTVLTLGRDLGTNSVAVTVVGIEQPITFMVEAVATPDFDGNGAVGFPDFLLFVAQFGLSQTDEGYDARFDLDGDGAIGFADFLIFASHFGKAVSSN